MRHQKKLVAAAVGSALVLGVSLSTPAWATNEPELNEAVDLLLAAEPTFADSIAPDNLDSTELHGAAATLDGNTITIESTEGHLSLEAPATTSNSSVTPVLLDDAEALFAIQIDTPDAPTRYDFAVSLPEDATHEFLENGGVVFTSGGDSFVGGVAAPWAKDADGAEVPTWFTYENQTLTQHVDLEGVTAFPVIADPYMGKWLISAAWVTYQADPSRYKINATPTQFGRDLGHQTANAHFSYHMADLKSRLGANASKVNDTITNQFFCHVGLNAYGGGDTYNLESWTPSHGWNSPVMILSGCNPV